MPTEDAYSSGHLVLSHFGTCKCSNVETNISWTCLVSGLLSFEHPSVLLFLPWIGLVRLGLNECSTRTLNKNNSYDVDKVEVFFSSNFRGGNYKNIYCLPFVKWRNIKPRKKGKHFQCNEASTVSWKKIDLLPFITYLSYLSLKSWYYDSSAPLTLLNWICLLTWLLLVFTEIR